MLISVTFTAEVEEIPTCCAKCPLVLACDGTGPKIFKGDGGEWTAAATKRRVAGCKMKVEDK